MNKPQNNILYKGEVWRKSNSNDHSTCNICESRTTLTRDHVPPRCCSNSGIIRYRKLFDENFFPSKQPRHSQSGIHFKTICSNCNNELLGKSLDPHLGLLQEQILNKLKSVNHLTDTISVTIDINKICRAVVGHLLAAFPFYNNGGIEPLLRNYFAGTSSNIEGQFLYFWINPEDTIAVSRNIGIASSDNLNNSCISLMKFPGGAFMLSNTSIDDNMINLLDYISSDQDHECTFEINLSSIYTNSGEFRSTDWPLIATDSRIFIISQEVAWDSYFSTPLN